MKTDEERKASLGFLGPEFSFSHAAAKGVPWDYSYLPFSTIQELLKAFQDREIDKAIIPTRNLLGGFVDLSIRWLFENGHRFSIELEIDLPIKQCLISAGEISEIEKVVSHPQALLQCDKSIGEMGIKTEECDSTSAAVKLVSKLNNSQIAAIGTQQAANAYGLKVLDENFQDHEDNVTRFFVLSHTSNSMTGNDKTTIVFGFPKAAGIGMLGHFLTAFTDEEINLSEFVSRPTQTGLEDSKFLVSMKGHQEEENVGRALEKARGVSEFLDILGSYPVLCLEQSLEV